MLELNVSVDAKGDFAINNERIPYVSPSQLASEMQKRVPKTDDGKGPVVIISADGAAVTRMSFIFSRLRDLPVWTD